MHWGQYSLCCMNDNTFVINWMLGYSTVLYDDVDKNGHLTVLMISPQRVTLNSVKIIIATYNQWLIIMKKTSCILKNI